MKPKLHGGYVSEFIELHSYEIKEKFDFMKIGSYQTASIQ